MSRALAGLSARARLALQRPSPAVPEILDPRPLLDEAASIAAAFGGTGLLIAETVTTALRHEQVLWLGGERNVGTRLREIADDLGIAIHVAT